MNKRSRTEETPTDPSFIFFWKPKDHHGHFSQWWNEDPFEENGITYPTAEHYMMLEKARLFADTVAEAKLHKTKSPRTAKSIGRAVKNFSPTKWDIHKFDIVYRASLAKYKNSPKLRKLLLDTGTNFLAFYIPPHPHR